MLQRGVTAFPCSDTLKVPTFDNVPLKLSKVSSHKVGLQEPTQQKSPTQVNSETIEEVPEEENQNQADKEDFESM